MRVYKLDSDLVTRPFLPAKKDYFNAENVCLLTYYGVIGMTLNTLLEFINYTLLNNEE